MKPAIPSGTRDFNSIDVQKRNYIFTVIRRNFELFGYQPIETPAMEKIGTLTGKYGEEGDQLIFKILNSRINESKEKDILKTEFDKSLNTAYNSEYISEKALRYDLTVPFARYVVMHQNALTFPFKRYQMQPVWRADKPQRGRYREFYQCDADVVGSNSLINELDLIALIDKSFFELKVPVTLKINNRKILTAIAELINSPDKVTDITVAIDKLDKIGIEGVNKELKEKNISGEAIEKLQPLLNFKGSNTEKIAILETMFNQSEIGKKGIEELLFLLNNSIVNHVMLELDVTLARGLNYYTGTIFEAKANAGTFTPSILGGGRYDDLTGFFGLKNLSGVGISFGIDRIYDVISELNAFPSELNNLSPVQLLIAHFDSATQLHAFLLAQQFRANDIPCEIFADSGKKLGKQFEYADKKNIPYVCVVGSNEIESKCYTLKNLKNSEQITLTIEAIIEKLKAQLTH
ncbi:MAG: histidine--tRNA ligase [Bacteroidetes bacterium]|nr:histidine--tRNA ligase [Bacteroidota bacterium]